MCGRFTLRSSAAEFANLFRIDVPFEVAHRYNIAPTQPHPIIRADGEHRVSTARWGLIPSWAKDRKIGYKLINARAETVAEKPSFRSAFERRRCLIPASGFYEWQVTHSGKQPQLISLTGGGLLAFAGLWERWEKGEQPLETFTIITTTANDLLSPIHNRMPVILPPEVFDVWLDPEVSPEAAQKLLQPFPAEEMQHHAVSTIVNNIRHETPECVEPL